MLYNYKCVIIIISVESPQFERDTAKDLANQRKHGFSFDEAMAVFGDPLYVSVQDRIEDGEPRWRTVGTLDGSVLLAVAHTIREELDQGVWIEVIRIISARRATRKERRHYEDEHG